GETLKIAADNLPAKFKSIATDCYRQIALEKSAVWSIGTKYQLSETISSWTTSLEISRTFKGGVPPIGYQGVIFKITPSDTFEVIINIDELFKCDDFKEYLESNKHQISNYDKGTGLYGDTQKEVVISAEYLDLHAIFAWGGYTSPESQLAEMYLGHEASSKELEKFRELMDRAGHKCGPYWLATSDAVSRVSEKLKLHGQRLSKIRD
ncbi:MAG: hypothetical protein ACREGC_03500, partial [Minisyncoccia bacterium]